MPQDVLQFAQFASPVIALFALGVAIFSYFTTRASLRTARDNLATAQANYETAKSSLATAQSSLATAQASLETANETFERAGPVVVGSLTFFSRKEGDGLRLTLMNKGLAPAFVVEVKFRMRHANDFRPLYEGGTDLGAPRGPGPNHILAAGASAEWAWQASSHEAYSFMMNQINWVEVKLGNGQKLTVDQSWEPSPEG